MFNEYGELIGIVTSRFPEGQNLNFAVPINYARGLLATQATMTLAELKVRFPSSASDLTSTSIETTSSQGGATEADPARLLELLEASGLRYEKVTDDIWSTVYGPGNNVESVTVFFRVYEEFVLIQSSVNNDSDLSSEQMTDMLSLNYNIDLARASLDSDGTITVLGQAELRRLDSPGLESIAGDVALLADEVAGVVGDPVSAGDGRELVRPAIAGATTLSLARGGFEIQYDPSEWNMQASSEPGEHELHHSTGDLYVMVIEERIQIPAETLLEVALASARDVDPNVTAIRRGSRVVNGVRMLSIDYEATVTGVPLVFVAHFFSDTSGSVQIIAWTGPNLLAEYRDTIERFVSGFEVSRR